VKTPCGMNPKGCVKDTIEKLRREGEDEVGNVCWFHCLLPRLRGKKIDGKEILAVPCGTTVKLRLVP